MTPWELFDAAKRANEQDNDVILVLPGKARGLKKRLVPGRHKCPMGEILNVADDRNETVAAFDPVEILAFLVACGAAKTETVDGEVVVVLA